MNEASVHLAHHPQAALDVMLMSLAGLCAAGWLLLGANSVVLENETTVRSGVVSFSKCRGLGERNHGAERRTSGLREIRLRLQSGMLPPGCVYDRSIP